MIPGLWVALSTVPLMVVEVVHNGVSDAVVVVVKDGQNWAGDTTVVGMVVVTEMVVLVARATTLSTASLMIVCRPAIMLTAGLTVTAAS